MLAHYHRLCEHDPACRNERAALTKGLAQAVVVLLELAAEVLVDQRQHAVVVVVGVDVGAAVVRVGHRRVRARVALMIIIFAMQTLKCYVNIGRGRVEGENEQLFNKQQQQQQQQEENLQHLQ